MTEDEMVGWHYRLKSEQTPGVDDGQGSLACFSPWGGKESDMTEHASTSLKAISPNVVTLGIRASTHEFGRGHSSVHSRR